VENAIFLRPKDMSSHEPIDRAGFPVESKLVVVVADHYQAGPTHHFAQGGMVQQPLALVFITERQLQAHKALQTLLNIRIAENIVKSIVVAEIDDQVLLLLHGLAGGPIVIGLPNQGGSLNPRSRRNSGQNE